MGYKALIIIVILFAAVSVLNAQDSLYLYKVFHGENDQDQFGVVENVGDVNGDGFEDLMVGAPGAPRNLFSDPPTRGYAKLYLGGTNFDTIPHMVFNYYGSFTTFGATIAGNGDLNGDGYSDFAIADPTFGNFSVGKVYVYFGGPQLDTIPDMYLTLNSNEYFYTQFGYSMAMNGDINGDGSDDLIIGAPLDDWDRHGEVFIYYGGEDMDDNYDVNLICPIELERFGYSLSYLDDANEDSINDLLVGALPNESYEQAFIFWGDRSGNISFENSNTFFNNNYYPSIGRVVGNIGDINHDGFKDFALLSSDTVTLCLSPLVGESFEQLYFPRTADLGSFYRLTGNSDINSDGFDDFIITCQRTQTIPGKVVILFGDSEVSLNQKKIIESTDMKFGFGDQIEIFSRLFTEDIVSIALGHVETGFYDEHGKGKVFIYNNDLINSLSIKSNAVDQSGFDITQNYPNPFNPTTNIVYQIPREGRVVIKLYNILGREIEILVDEHKAQGRYELTFDGSRLSSGVYIYRISAGELSASKKFILIK
ncbi:MAG: T9SS type A sorting domain-containing protein [Melioribacteraceae bacterium]|nr:T9SS type A sorting domain-containing protein [Melioribacteraceae bacterium]MCF8356783.1 T9SS type A sorting domain-containing protein [Melioribacteraceae bacterium]MCF8396155.1 T9SS type A sorting domain-containing protein [Melioribacteraceae bacterium]MCF8421107.1 T9SS type A sorting domain-containing protein [Melioribacteraceae bacterium]